jgi:hypothetical protein
MPGRRSRPDPVPDILVQVLAVPHWSESRRLVEEHPELLDTAVLERLLSWIEEAERKSGRMDMAREHLDVLRSCREVGIPAAFAPLVPDHKGLDPPETTPMLRQAQLAEELFDTSGDASQLEVAAAAWEYFFTDQGSGFTETPPEIRAFLRGEAARVHVKRFFRVNRDRADYDRAIQLLEQAVAEADPARPLRGHTQALLTELRSNPPNAGP